MLKDGEIIVFHDYNLKRLTGLNQNVNTLKYEDIKDLTIHKTNEHILLFKDLLKYVEGRVPLLIELKPFGHTKTFCQNVYDILKDYQGEYAVFSFNPMVLRWFRLKHPEIIRGQIAETFKDSKEVHPFLGRLLGKLRFNILTKPDFISYKLKHMPNKYLDRCKQKGLTVISYAAQNQKELNFVKSHYHNAVFEYFIPKK